jgi:hypothetical protein
VRRRGPRPQLLLSHARPVEANRMSLCDSPHWGGAAPKTGRPNLTSIPSRTGGRGRFLARSEVGRHSCAACQGCPESTARGSGAAPHDRTCAPDSTAGVWLTVARLRSARWLSAKETHEERRVRRGIRGSMLSPDGATCRDGAVG